MNWLHWNKGRQDTGYEKMLLLGAIWPIRFDFYLLRFKKGQYIPAHIDAVESGKHYRLNVIIKTALEGGDFVCENPIYTSKRINLFRSDLSEHSVTEIIIGSRYVLSLGWILKT